VSKSLRFVLNLPPKGCSANASGSAFKHAKDKKAYREESEMETRSAMQKAGFEPGHIPVPIRVALTFYTFKTPLTTDRYRPKDYDNTARSAKQIYDGIKSAGLVPDDTKKWMRPEMPTLNTTRAEAIRDGITKPCVIVEIEQL